MFQGRLVIVDDVMIYEVPSSHPQKHSLSTFSILFTGLVLPVDQVVGDPFPLLLIEQSRLHADHPVHGGLPTGAILLHPLHTDQAMALGTAFLVKPHFTQFYRF